MKQIELRGAELLTRNYLSRWEIRTSLPFTLFAQQRIMPDDHWAYLKNQLRFLPVDVSRLAGKNNLFAGILFTWEVTYSLYLCENKNNHSTPTDF